MVTASVAATLAVAGVGVWGVVYHFALPSTDPCSGITTPTSPTNSSVAPATQPRAPALRADPSPGGPPDTQRPSALTVGPAPTEAAASSSGPVIQVVAAENFWGSLVAQIGGTHVNVTSIISDPNTDPHEYQQNDSVPKAIAHAQYIILNNVGYDSWASQDVASDGATNQTVLNIGDSLGVSVTGGIVTGNPHLWYNPTYVNETVAWMYHNLTTIAPSLTAYFTAQYDNLTASLAQNYSLVGEIRHQFAGTVVASTESIFVYLANATGLDLVSPPAFMEAIAEGNDPPDQSVVTFQCQLESGHVHVLVFNAQTVTPITTEMQQKALENNVSVISLTETIQPPTVSFQTWMEGELIELYRALDAKQLGQ